MSSSIRVSKQNSYITSLIPSTLKSINIEYMKRYPMEECLFCGFIPIDFTEYSGAAVKVTLFKDAKEWLIDELESWDFTFEEETEIPKYINKIREDEILTEDEYKEILFHLWQKLH